MKKLLGNWYIPFIILIVWVAIVLIAAASTVSAHMLANICISVLFESLPVRLSDDHRDTFVLHLTLV